MVLHGGAEPETNGLGASHVASAEELPRHGPRTMSTTRLLPAAAGKSGGNMRQRNAGAARLAATVHTGRICSWSGGFPGSPDPDPDRVVETWVSRGQLSIHQR
jgi:hypothetical protein